MIQAHQIEEFDDFRDNSLEARLLRIEYVLIPRTQLSGMALMRAALPKSGKFGWCLVVGIVNRAKEFFYGHTIEEAVCLAEETARERDLDTFITYTRQMDT